MTKDEMIVTLQRALDLLKRDRYPDPEINAVITALRGINSKPIWYVVVDADGLPEYVAIDKHSAHDHINDSISIHETENAGKWKVIPLYTAPPELLPQPTTSSKLRKFTDECIDAALEGSFVYGCEIQDRALKLGLLKEVTATEQCGEGCICAEVVGFPTQCYRKTYLDAAPLPAGFTDAQIEAAARALFECDSCVYYQYSEDTEQDWEEAKEAIYRNVKTILEAAVKAGTTA